MIGVQIAVLRRDAGMTQAELARHIHVSASTIGMYEQGRRLPAAPILVALSKVFGVSIDYLVTGALYIPKDIARVYPEVKKGREGGAPCADKSDTYAILRSLANLYAMII